jgi:hypothetical protein
VPNNKISLNEKVLTVARTSLKTKPLEELEEDRCYLAIEKEKEKEYVNRYRSYYSVLSPFLKKA